MAPPTSAQFSLTIRVRIDHRPGMLGRVATAIGEQGGLMGDVELVAEEGTHVVRDFTVQASSHEHGDQIVEAIRGVAGADVVDVSDRTFMLHVGGKIEMRNKAPLKSRD